MPIYEYKCMKCNNEFEAMQKFSDLPVSKCPNCGGQVKKMVSRSTFHLKGSGWYLTDYAKKNAPRDTNSSMDESGTSSDSSSVSDSTTSSSED